MATLTVYPDEVTTGDGSASQWQDDAGSNWATIVAGVGNLVYNANDDSYVVYIGGNAATWRQLTRAIFTFDTSALGAGAIITSAKFCLYGSSKTDNLVITPNINIYNATPSVNRVFAVTDYAQTGGATPTAYCDTAITYAGWSITGYNDFTLNAAGLAAINKTGITKICTRNANYDAAGSEPGTLNANSSTLSAWFTEKGTTYRPYLEITYTIPITTNTVMFGTNM